MCSCVEEKSHSDKYGEGRIPSTTDIAARHGQCSSIPPAGEATPYFQGAVQELQSEEHTTTATAPPNEGIQHELHSVEHMAVASAPPYYQGVQQEIRSLDHMTAESSPPPYQSILQTQPSIHGYGTPLRHQPTRHQGFTMTQHTSFCGETLLACLGSDRQPLG